MMKWCGRTEKAAAAQTGTMTMLAVQHARLSDVTDEQLRSWLEGQGEQPTIKGVREIAEAMIWKFVEQARAGMDWIEAGHKIDAMMEFQAQLEMAMWRKKRG